MDYFNFLNIDYKLNEFNEKDIKFKNEFIDKISNIEINEIFKLKNILKDINYDNIENHLNFLNNFEYILWFNLKKLWDSHNFKLNDKYWCYIPFSFYLFYNIMKFLEKDHKNYYFYDLGSGIPTKVLTSNLLGFKSIGYDIDETILYLSDILNLNNFIEYKDITKIEKFNHPSIIYYYKPIKNDDDYLKFTENIIKNLKKGDIIIPFICEIDINKFKLEIVDFENNKKLNKYNSLKIYKKI